MLFPLNLNGNFLGFRHFFPVEITMVSSVVLSVFREFSDLIILFRFHKNNNCSIKRTTSVSLIDPGPIILLKLFIAIRFNLISSSIQNSL